MASPILAATPARIGFGSRLRRLRRPLLFGMEQTERHDSSVHLSAVNVKGTRAISRESSMPAVSVALSAIPGCEKTPLKRAHCGFLGRIRVIPPTQVKRAVGDQQAQLVGR